MADYIFTGGGTGGHLYPALAVADALVAARPGTEVLFVGTPDRIEARVVPQAGYRFEAIAARGLSRRPLEALKALGLLVGAVWKASRILAREHPRAVLGTGGYVSAPLLLAARLRGVPVFLQEQNVFPGKVNRWIARFAHTVAVSFPGSERHFPSRPLTLIGNPIRAQALRIDRAAARSALGLDPARPLLLVTGGSQGAQRINEAVAGVLDRIMHETDWSVLHVAGPNNLEAAEKAAGAWRDHPRYRLVGYLEAMPEAIVASDLVITRAGATTLAELTAAGKPMLLVPYPYAGGHQRLNAEAIVEAGAGLELEDLSLTAAKLEPVLLPLMQDRARLAEMGARASALGRPEAAEQLAGMLLAVGQPGPAAAGGAEKPGR